MKSIILLGPTATGKSKLAIELAKEINGEIISADSMQVYRGMDIGTAKPTEKEKQGVAHHLIDIRNPDEEWTVANFVKETEKLKNRKTKKPLILVGGTGLYLWSLFEGYSFPDAPSDKSIRDKLSKVDSAKLYTQLSKVDPEAAKKIHPNNKKRVVRALEVFELTGKPISKQQKRNGTVRRRRTGSEHIIIGLTLPREQLYSRINSRADQMIEKGLIDEVKGLLAKGYSKDLNSMQALGYKEVIEYLDGNWDKDKMIEEIKKRTRHFAKRQMTWFKKFKDVKWLEQPVDFKQIIDYINK